MTENDDSPAVRQVWATGITVSCIVLIIGWQIAILVASWTTEAGPTLTPSDFEQVNFVWQGERAVRSQPYTDELQVDLLVFTVPLHPRDGTLPAVDCVLRLVHGYNMHDCMRIKGYTVTPLQDSTSTTASPAHIEFWNLRSAEGNRSVWGTGLIRADDFTFLAKSVTDLPFPKVGTPDETDWKFNGLTLESLKHPIRNLSNLVRSKWNGARSDPGTFLKIKKPARPSSDILTVVGWIEVENDEPIAPQAQQELRRIIEAFVREINQQARPGRLDSSGSST